MADTLKLIENQNKRKQRFMLITAKEAGVRLTRSTILERLRELEQLFDEFKEDHDKIIEVGKPDIPYIVNNLGGKVMDLMGQAMDELRQDPNLTLNVPELNMTIGAGEFLKFSESVSQEMDKSDNGITNNDLQENGLQTQKTHVHH